MIKFVKAISDLAEKLLIVLCIALFIIITFAAFMQVFTRFALGNAWKWTDEACRYCLVWLTMLGAALGVKRHAHLAIDVVMNLTPRAFQHLVGYFSDIVIIIFSIVLVRQGITLCVTFMQQRSAVLGLPMGLVYMAIPLLGVFLALFYIADLFEHSTGKIGGNA